MTTRITGLNSGLDVDALVEAGASYYQSKVNTAKQSEQKLQWQQDQYRTIQSSVQTFYDKYLSTTGEDSLMLSSNWNTNSYTSSDSSKVSVSSTSDANINSYTVGVKQLASAATGTLSTSTNYSNGLEISVNGGTSIKITAAQIKSAIGSTDLSTTTTSSSTAQKAIATLINSNISSSGATAAYSEFSGGIVLQTNTLGGNTSISVTDDSTQSPISLKNSSGATQTSVKGSYLNATITNGSGTSYTIGDNSTDNNQHYNSNSITLDGVTFNFNGVTNSTSTSTSTINSSNINSLFSGSDITQTGPGTKVYNLSNGMQIDANNSPVGIKKTDGTTLKSGESVSFTSSDGSIKIINGDGTVTTKIGNTSASITGTKDVSDVQNKIQSFMDDYNTLIKTINGKIYEKHDSSYQPLTDSQKSSMTDTQITKWETKAQTGLLRHDSYLEKLASDMKSAMSSMFKSAGIDIESIGIKAVDDYTTKNGTYTVNSDTLKSALEGNLTGTNSKTGKTQTISFDDIKNLFTNGNTLISSFSTKNSDTDGVLSRLKVAFNTNATMSTSELAKRAGIAGTTSETTNEITQLLKDQSDQLTTLEQQLSDKEDALYSKYSKLETSLSSLQSSSSIFSS